MCRQTLLNGSVWAFPILSIKEAFVVVVPIVAGSSMSKTFCDCDIFCSHKNVLVDQNVLVDPSREGGKGSLQYC